MISPETFEKLFEKFPFEKTEIVILKSTGTSFTTEGYLPFPSTKASTDELGFIEKSTSTAFLPGEIDVEVGDQLTAYGKTFRIISLQDYNSGNRRVAMKVELELIDV